MSFRLIPTFAFRVAAMSFILFAGHAAASDADMHAVAAAPGQRTVIHVDGSPKTATGMEASALASTPRLHQFLDPVLILANPAPRITSTLIDNYTGVTTGDVNGDGLVDLLWPAVGGLIGGGFPQDNNAIGIMIALRRRGGGFEFAKNHPIKGGCYPHNLALVSGDPDPGKEILFQCTIPGSNPGEFQFAGFAVLDVKADGTSVATLPIAEPYLWSENFSVVDVNQDGHDDIFLTHFDEAASIAAGDHVRRYRYRIWYGMDALHYAPYVSAPFIYHPDLLYGVIGQSDEEKYTVAGAPVDLDGDGAKEVLEGRCPLDGGCYFRQEPYRQLVLTDMPDGGGSGHNAYLYVDFDGDGLPDRFYGCVYQEPGADAYLGFCVDVQVGDAVFEPLAFIGPLPIGTPPLVADFDLNGLIDILAGNGTQGMIVLYQETPGAFRVATRPTQEHMLNTRMNLADINGDLCPDVLMTERAVHTNGYIQLYMGDGCRTPGDLGVSVTATAKKVVATVKNAAGPRTYDDHRAVRVVIAPSVQDDSRLQIRVVPPPGCLARQARAPRRVYDCALATLAPGAATNFEFELLYNKTWSPTVLQARAFLLDDTADGNALNNRARAAVAIDRKLVHTGPDPSEPAPAKRRPGLAPDSGKRGNRENLR